MHHRLLCQCVIRGDSDEAKKSIASSRMKSGGSQHGDDSDLFGPASSRVYGSSGGGFVTKLRPTMISAKYRLKEERRKVLKISINKLRKIEDPESSLRRSVLINNTMKRLQREAREEKLQKQYPNRNQDNPPAVSSSTPLPSREADKENASPFPLEKAPQQDTKPISRLIVCDESIDELVDAAEESAPASRKRPFDEVEDCDVQDVLSQFYMPPTPRMLTSIDDTDDEDEDVNVVDIDIVTSDMTLSSALQSSGVLTPEPSKRPRLDENVSKRPRFHDDDEGENVEVNVVDIEMSLASSCDNKRSRFDEDSVVDVVGPTGQLEQHNDECDRLCRTLILTPPPPPPPPIVPQSSDDPEDIEVVLEDNEDVERRLFLCSNSSRPRTTRSEDNMGAGSWRSPPSSDTDSHLRFDSNTVPNDKNMISPCANFCLGSSSNSSSSSNNNNGMVIDTSEHQYSCGHSSMFGEIQSVVYHSLIASLES